VNEFGVDEDISVRNKSMEFLFVSLIISDLRHRFFEDCVEECGVYSVPSEVKLFRRKTIIFK